MTQLRTMVQEEINKLDEKWKTPYKTPESKKGMFKGDTIADLEKQRSKLRKRADREKETGDKHVDQDTETKQDQVNFAIRAKKGWPKGKGSSK